MNKDGLFMERLGMSLLSSHHYPTFIHSTVSRNLKSAVEQISRNIAQGRLDSLPPYAPAPFPVPGEERITIFDWMALTCYPEEFARQQHRAALLKQEEDFRRQAAGQGSGTDEKGDIGHMKYD